MVLDFFGWSVVGRPASEQMSQSDPILSKKVKQILATLKHTLYDWIFGGWTVGRPVGR